MYVNDRVFPSMFVMFTRRCIEHQDCIRQYHSKQRVQHGRGHDNDGTDNEVNVDLEGERGDARGSYPADHDGNGGGKTLANDTARGCGSVDEKQYSMHTLPRSYTEQRRHDQRRHNSPGRGTIGGAANVCSVCTLRMLSAYLTTTATVSPPKATSRITVHAIGV